MIGSNLKGVHIGCVLKLWNLIMHQSTKKRFKILVEEEEEERWYLRKVFGGWRNTYYTTPKFITYYHGLVGNWLDKTQLDVIFCVQLAPVTCINMPVWLWKHLCTRCALISSKDKQKHHFGNSAEDQLRRSGWRWSLGFHANSRHLETHQSVYLWKLQKMGVSFFISAK